MSMGSALAWADDESIVLDFVRHGESIDNMAGIIDTTPPGTALDATGEGQASDVATAIQNEYGTNIAGVFDSEELRTQQTATAVAGCAEYRGRPYSGRHDLERAQRDPGGRFRGRPDDQP